MNPTTHQEIHNILDFPKFQILYKSIQKESLIVIGNKIAISLISKVLFEIQLFDYFTFLFFSFFEKLVCFFFFLITQKKNPLIIK